MDQALKSLRILAVDDEDSDLLLVRRMLEWAGYTQVVTTADPTQVPAMVLEARPDLILLDLHMPEMDGFELMERLAPLQGDGASIPVLVLTADAMAETKRQALSAGARDFVTKPLDQVELLLRVRNLLQTQQLQARLAEHNTNLEAEVVERTRDLDLARLEMLERLALAAEYRDDDTQEHAWRIGRTSALLATEVGVPLPQVELIRRAAPLHDVGKIGISDLILRKPAKLTDEEFEVVKSHPTIGAEILAGSQSPLLRLAQTIALTHHERWDGRGYPGGLLGSDTPIEGRIVAVADVFDALTHERSYKEAWPLDKAVAEIRVQAGHQFDPELVDAFCELDHPTLLNRVTDFEQSSEWRVLGSEMGVPAHA
jgi:putative two-component system response regulator